MKNVQDGQAREILLAENQGFVDLVLPVSRRCADDASMVPASGLLNWQYQAAEEQWQTICEMQKAAPERGRCDPTSPDQRKQ